MCILQAVTWTFLIFFFQIFNSYWQYFFPFYLVFSFLFCFYHSVICLATRDNLHNDLEKLRDEQRYMENDLSNIQIRWHTLREEKVKAANTLRDVKKAEEELDRLVEEKSQVDLHEKVVCSFKIANVLTCLICFYLMVYFACRW